MPRYRLLLHDGPADPPVSQDLLVADDEDARDIARISLLVTQAYTHAELYRGAALIEAYHRDGPAAAKERSVPRA